MRYTEETVALIEDRIRNLSGRKNACKDAALDYQTFLNWLEGKLPQAYLDEFPAPERESHKFDFLDRIKKAEAYARENGEEFAVAAIFNAMPKQWQPAAWWLERNFPHKYGVRIKKDVTHHMPESNDKENLQARLDAILHPQ